ncbi:hypothetical protein [Ramlibacter montanisoli]|uniref:SMODS-associating 2TM beta-strand rich effector domain-containing protein n=1 Tax=Ramlibacter montanisoli TaxID=2732512 RepID=A0A849KEV1_9BURK|nr:hypothetical protein [Ramlibacter montanisoli]NNU44757.1 hypothetical protein [Ramlibacter montanisoli]
MAESFLDFDFGTGVASGALTAFFLCVAAHLWVQRLLPLVRRFWYRGVNISGEWKGLGTGYTPAHGEWSELVLALQQDGRQVRGTVTLQCRSAGHAFDVRLQATGKVTEGYVALSLSPTGESVPSPATALLKIEDRGAALNGQLLYRHPFLDIVDVIDMSVHRAHSAASAQLRPAAAPAPHALPAAARLPAGTALD